MVISMKIHVKCHTGNSGNVMCFFTVNYSITFLLSPKAVNLTVFYSIVFYCKGRLRSNTFSIFSNETYFNQLLFLQSLSRVYFFK